MGLTKTWPNTQQERGGQKQAHKGQGALPENSLMFLVGINIYVQYVHF